MVLGISPFGRVVHQNMVIAKIGTEGNVCVTTSGSPAHVLADYTGQFRNDSPVVALPPARLLDTRPGGTTIDGLPQSAGLVSPNAIVTLPVANRGGVGATAERCCDERNRYKPNS
jgi:hypothetical protein